jgi:putative transposase
MIVLKAYKYELNPNNKQKTAFIKSCGTSRFVWNWGLAKRIELYNTKQGKERFTSFYKQNIELNSIKYNQYPWMLDVSKCVAQESLQDLDRAYADLIRRIQNHSKKYGRPKFKKKGERDSFRLTNNVADGKTSTLRLDGNKIHLPKIGFVRVKEDTSSFSGKILNVTIKKESERWYCCLKVSKEITDVKNNGGVIGIDVGLKNYLTTYDGNSIDIVEHHKSLSKKLSRLKILAQQQARTKKGSHNRHKANIQLSKCHKHIENTRHDFIAKLTSQLAKTKSVICIEDLKVENLKRNKILGRSISDSGWGIFREMLEYKTKWYGSRLILIPTSYPSSKMCSDCHYIFKGMTLDDRNWVCPNCGVKHDRDENAAQNIYQYGLDKLNTGGSSGINVCGVDVSLPYKVAIDRETESKQLPNTKDKSYRTVECGRILNP